jgi:hypothetical protein
MAVSKPFLTLATTKVTPRIPENGARSRNEGALGDRGRRSLAAGQSPVIRTDGRRPPVLPSERSCVLLNLANLDADRRHHGR